MTVAKRIWLGFSVITLLLVITSVSSLFFLNDIEHSSRELNSKSLPELISSKELQIQFLKMNQLIIDSSGASNLLNLNANIKKFNYEKQILDQVLADIKQIALGDTVVLNSIFSVENIFSIFEKNTQQLLGSYQDKLKLQVKMTNQVASHKERLITVENLLFELLDIMEEDRALLALDNDLQVMQQHLKLIFLLNADEAVSEQKLFNYASESIIADTLIMDTSINSLVISHGQALANQYKKVSELANGFIVSFKNENPFDTKKLLMATKSENAAILITAQQATKSALTQLEIFAKVVLTNTATYREEVSGDIEQAGLQTKVIMMLSIVFAVTIATFTTRSIIRPLSRVNNILTSVAAGNLTKNLDETAKDEFGNLASNVNKLITSLKTLIGEIKEQSSSLASSSSTSTKISEESTVAIQTQRELIEQTATATTQMSQTSLSVVSLAGESNKEIDSANTEAEKIKDFSQKNRKAISHLAVEINEASSVIDSLNDDSKKIGVILDVIRGISDQTNLLALNAAIEAARAGEHGRGFSVVADEVRTLANRTSVSTEQIQTMISSLQNRAEKAVDVMQNSKIQTEHCVEYTKKVSNAVDMITTVVANSKRMSASIEAAANEQSMVSIEISQSLVNMVSIAEQSASGAQQTLQSSQKVSLQSEELRVSVEAFVV